MLFLIIFLFFLARASVQMLVFLCVRATCAFDLLNVNMYIYTVPLQSLLIAQHPLRSCEM